MEYGDTLSANTALGSAISIYLHRQDYVKAKAYLDKYEFHSDLTGKEPFKDKQHYLLYYRKGVYFSATYQYDSASIAYRKLISKGEIPNNRLLGYHGLYRLLSANGYI
jgi:hypothetical protein